MQDKKQLTPYEQAIRYLSQVENIDGMIQEKQDVIETLCASVSGTAIRYDSDHVQSSPRDKLGETCAKIVDLCAQMQDDINRLIEKKGEVMQTIDDCVDDLQSRKLLYLRYIKYLSIETAAHEMRISRAKAYRLHRSGVWCVSRKLNVRKFEKI